MNKTGDTMVTQSYPTLVYCVLADDGLSGIDTTWSSFVDNTDVMRFGDT